jgi:phospholipid/cholesterol/gamma-HCH transport system substrate-binding protein
VVAAVVGAVVAALLLGGCGFAGMQDLPLPGGPAVGDHSYRVTAEFDDVLSLARDSTVKLDGVTVGRVDAVGREGWKALVTLRLRGDVALPADVRAKVAQTSLLGEKYVDLEIPPGGGTGRLRDGSRIALSHTSRGREVEEVLGALSLLLNGGGLAQLHTVAAELDRALADTDANRTFLRELGTFVGTLDRNRATIVATLADVDRLSGRIARDRATVQAALDHITPAVQALAAQRRQVLGMIGHLSRFSTVTSAVVRRTGADLVADLQALEPVLAQLERAGDDLPRVLETVLSFPFPDEVLNAVKGDYVNLDVLVDLSPLVLAGNVAGDNEQLGGLPGLLTGQPAPSTAPVPPASAAAEGLGGTLSKLLGGVLGGGS